MGSPCGSRISRQRFTETLEAHFDALFDGRSFSFDPVLKALLRVQGVSEQDLFVPLVNISGQLGAFEVELVFPELSLSEQARRNLLQEAQLATEEARLAHQASKAREAIANFNRTKLGALLVKEGLLSEAQLSAALELQQRVGGRLGTNLVEMGMLSEHDLAHFLSMQLQIPCVDVDALRGVEPKAVEAVPASCAVRHRLVPTRLGPRRIEVLMANPACLEAIDEVAILTGRRVYPLVGPELLIDSALERYYGVRRAPRVLDHHEQRFRATQAQSPCSISDVGQMLAFASEEAEVLGTIFRVFLGWFEQGLVFKVFQDEGGAFFQGWCQQGAATEVGDFRKCHVRGDSAPAMEGVCASASLFQGEPGVWLAKLLKGGSQPTTIMPIAVNGEVRALCVGAEPQRASPKLESLMRMAADAWEMVEIRQRLLRSEGD